MRDIYGGPLVAPMSSRNLLMQLCVFMGMPAPQLHNGGLADRGELYYRPGARGPA